MTLDTIHKSKDDGHLVGIGDLRVMLVHENGSWFAQGMEIDYSSQGETVEEAKDNFARGLKLTIREHLKKYGGIDRLLAPAPADVWKEFTLGVLTMVCVHDLTGITEELHGRFVFPYDRIQYMQQKEAA